MPSIIAPCMYLICFPQKSMEAILWFRWESVHLINAGKQVSCSTVGKMEVAIVFLESNTQSDTTVI